MEPIISLIQYGSAVVFLIFAAMLFIAIVGRINFRDERDEDDDQKEIRKFSVLERILIGLSGLLTLIIYIWFTVFLYKNYYFLIKEYQDKVDANSSGLATITSITIPGIKDDIRDNTSSIKEKMDNITAEEVHSALSNRLNIIEKSNNINSTGIDELRNTEVPKLKNNDEEYSERLDTLESELFPIDDKEKEILIFSERVFNNLGYYLETYNTDNILKLISESWSQDSISDLEPFIKDIKASYSNINNSEFYVFDSNADYIDTFSNEVLDVWQVRILYSFSFNSNFTCPEINIPPNQNVKIIDSWIKFKVAFNKNTNQHQIWALDRLELIPSYEICASFND